MTVVIERLLKRTENGNKWKLYISHRDGSIEPVGFKPSRGEALTAAKLVAGNTAQIEVIE